ncbi:TetR/AcrR family transcriptional regulator [Sneathiella limimaris]|uniref:TetR/AcrR family transcriptional regulator n=1 Tax=Sneathiella limimaris TaxID=1964213 RepID=UPI00146E5AA4|nr:TetR/AcrR family transcriptional regulator [Sneathiella limimaris]
MEIQAKGVKPALQGRSRQRRDELINAGMILMQDKSFADISIIDLTAHCGYSVGTFYSRFEDKESFFKAVQEAATASTRAQLEEEFSKPFWKTASLEEIFTKLVNTLFELIAGPHKGVVRASIVLSGSDPEMWKPIHEAGIHIRKMILGLLEERYLKSDPDKSIKSIEFALQMFFGTAVQAILNDPGPVRLTDPEMRQNLTRMFLTYIILEPDKT